MSVESEIMGSIIKQAMTDEKISEMAKKLAPAIEKAITLKINDQINDYFDDIYIGDWLDDDIQTVMMNAVRSTFNLPPKTVKKGRR